jgi:hypothetical protein
MRPIVQTILASGIQPPIPVDIYLTPFELSQTLSLGTGASITYTFQYCNDDPYANYATNYNTNGNWISDPNATGQTGTLQDGISVPCRAVRINVASFTAGTTPTTFTVVQAGVR